MFSLDIYNLEMPSVPSVYLLQVDANSVTAASEFITNLEQLDLNSTVLAAVNHNSLKESWRSRQLLAYSDEDATKFIVVADNLDDTYFVLYAEELRIYYSDSDGSFNVSCCYDSNSNNESATFIDAGATEVSGDNRTVSFNVSQYLPDGLLDANLTIRVAYKLNGSYWSVSYMEFQQFSGDEGCAFLSASSAGSTSYQVNIEGVPSGTAFKCTPDITYYINNRTCPDSEQPQINVNISFIGLQIDPGRNLTLDHPKNITFSNNVDDCVGYFSPGTWAGLITSLVLGLILFLAIYIMLGMQVMDRFDDPKGKSINVQAT
jgi:hypothetical protein